MTGPLDEALRAARRRGRAVAAARGRADARDRVPARRPRRPAAPLRRADARRGRAAMARGARATARAARPPLGARRRGRARRGSASAPARLTACSPESSRRSAACARSKDGRLVVERGSVDAAIGDSVAVDGVCLTVVERGEETLAFDVVAGDRVRACGRSARRSTSSPPCVPATRWAATSSRATSTASGACAPSTRRGSGSTRRTELLALRRREGLDRRRRRLAHGRGARRGPASGSRSSRTPAR